MSVSPALAEVSTGETVRIVSPVHADRLPMPPMRLARVGPPSEPSVTGGYVSIDTSATVPPDARQKLGGPAWPSAAPPP